MVRPRVVPRFSPPGTALPVLACLLLGACAVRPLGGGRVPGALRLDTETVGRMRSAASLQGVRGLSASSTLRVVASRISQLAPEVLAVFLHDESELERLEDALLECVQGAEREINAERFGGRAPSAAECKAVVGVDRCGRPISQAMDLGTVKHAHALACMRDILSELWPGPFSIEQRYRYYSHANLIEVVSREEEQRFIDDDCTGELWRTIKPDVVLHADRNLLRGVLILELKFPCVGGNLPAWTEYGGKSAYNGSSQKQIYEKALSGKALLLSPKGIEK